MPTWYTETPTDIEREQNERNWNLFDEYLRGLNFDIRGHYTLGYHCGVKCYVAFVPEWWLFFHKSVQRNLICWKYSHNVLEYSGLDKDLVFGIAKYNESIFGKELVIKHNKKLYLYECYGYQLNDGETHV